MEHNIPAPKVLSQISEGQLVQTFLIGRVRGVEDKRITDIVNRKRLIECLSFVNAPWPDAVKKHDDVAESSIHQQRICHFELVPGSER